MDKFRILNPVVAYFVAAAKRFGCGKILFFEIEALGDR